MISKGCRSCGRNWGDLKLLKVKNFCLYQGSLTSCIPSPGSLHPWTSQISSFPQPLSQSISETLLPVPGAVLPCPAPLLPQKSWLCCVSLSSLVSCLHALKTATGKVLAVHHSQAYHTPCSAALGCLLESLALFACFVAHTCLLPCLPCLSSSSLALLSLTKGIALGPFVQTHPLVSDPGFEFFKTQPRIFDLSSNIDEGTLHLCPHLHNPNLTFPKLKSWSSYLNWGGKEAHGGSLCIHTWEPSSGDSSPWGKLSVDPVSSTFTTHLESDCLSYLLCCHLLQPAPP